MEPTIIYLLLQESTPLHMISKIELKMAIKRMLTLTFRGLCALYMVTWFYYLFADTITLRFLIKLALSVHKKPRCSFNFIK